MADILSRLTASLSDRYAFERELGRGGMATVYLARDIKHDRAVAVKVLHPELGASIGSDRFEREIRLAAKLQHPHILGLYDSGAADGLLFYVMPFVQGESLRDRLDREGQLPIEDAIQITLEVADALGHAHSQGIVHRDIKPENVLLSNGHALVADFGIARAASEGGGPKLTQTGMAIGTPVYMAPEQAVGDQVGPTADIYSLGCMLYEMLAGEPPFTGKSGQAIMARHAMEMVPSVRIVRGTVPEEVEEAIFASMSKVPADRPQSAAQFTEILGVPLGATATRRVTLRHTATRRIPTPELMPVRRAWWKRPVVIGGMVAVLAAGGLAAWKLTSGGSGTTAVDGVEPTNIAVLYFEDLSPNKDFEFLTKGLTEGLIANLATVSGLTVVSKLGVEPFRASGQTADTIASIAGALRVGTVVTGTVESRGDRVEVQVRLKDRSGSDVSRRTFVMPASNLLAVQDSLTQETEEMIRRDIGAEIQQQRRLETTKSTEAWSFYQRAEQVRERGDAALKDRDTTTMNREFAAADSLYRLAQRADDRWPDPLVGRARIADVVSRFHRNNPLRLRSWIDRGLAVADSAVQLSATNPDALEVRGNLRYSIWVLNAETDQKKLQDALTAAQADLERATELNKQQAGAWASLSHLYYQNSSTSQVIVAAQNAYSADAYLKNADVILQRLFLATYDDHQFTEADRWCQELRRRYPESYHAPRCELFMLTTTARTPNIDRAWLLADSVGQMAAQPVQAPTAKLLAAAVIGRASRTDAARKAELTDSAKRVVEANVKNPEIDPARDLTQYGAFVYTILEEPGRAIDLLTEYVAANQRRRAGFAGGSVGWWFAPLLTDPRFKKLANPTG